MTALLLSIHVLAAIVLIGPITVAASLFPRYARAEVAAPGSGNAGVVHALHRISAGYAIAAVAVPVFGLATAVQLGVLTDVWLLASMALTVVAAVLLGSAILPAQRRVIAALDGSSPVTALLSRLAMWTGLFSRTWAVVVVLMIVRPGSTTGT
jgi:hypothetical protein